MCTVSMIMDYGRKYIPVDEWTPEGYDAFKKTIEVAKEFDKVTGQPDCESDDKTAWMKSVEERLKALESDMYQRQHKDLFRDNKD